MEPSSLLEHDLGKEIHNPIMSMLWGYGGRFREKEIWNKLSRW